MHVDFYRQVYWSNIKHLSELSLLSDDHCVKQSLQGPDYKKILRLSYDVIITYDNRKSNLR